MKIKLTFRVVEIHTVEREVPDEDLNSQKHDNMSFLEEKFDGDFSDSDFYTESSDLIEWARVTDTPLASSS